MGPVQAVYLLGAYLVGAIPFGLLFGKALGGVDVRAVGSGNIGATNVLRVAGKKAAILTLVADCLKGLFPVLLAARLFSSELISVLSELPQSWTQLSRLPQVQGRQGRGHQLRCCTRGSRPEPVSSA